MENLIFDLFAFVLVFLIRLACYLVTDKKKGKKKKRNGISMEMFYLITKFHLSEKRIDTKGMAAIISLLDALIITITLELVLLITNKIWLELILGLVIVIGLILGIYGVFGKILLKKGFDKNE